MRLACLVGLHRPKWAPVVLPPAAGPGIQIDGLAERLECSQCGRPLGRRL